MKKVCFDKYRLNKDQFLLPLTQKSFRHCYNLRYLWWRSTYGVVKGIEQLCFKGAKVTQVQRTDSVTHTEYLCMSVILKLYFFCVLGASKLYFAKLEYEKGHCTSPVGQDRKIMVACK